MRLLSHVTFFFFLMKILISNVTDMRHFSYLSAPSLSFIFFFFFNTINVNSSSHLNLLLLYIHDQFQFLHELCVSGALIADNKQTPQNLYHYYYYYYHKSLIFVSL